MDAEPTAEPPIDPNTATDLVEFKDLLGRLRASRGKSFKQLERDAGPGKLSHAMAHRLVHGSWDLTRIRDCPQVVGTFVATLGEDPGPWTQACERLIEEAKHPTAPPRAAPAADPRAPWWRRPRRRFAVIAAVVVLAAGGIVAWSVRGGDPAAVQAIDYTRPVRIEFGDAGLRLAAERDADEPGAAAVLASADTATSWELVAPHRTNPEYRQLRPSGKVLMCLDVSGGSFAELTPVLQWACHGERNQYWKVEPDPSGDGAMRVVNLNSGQCLTAPGTQQVAGTPVVQRFCGQQPDTQRWRISTAERPPPAAAQVAPGPDPAEYPGGGKDQPCPGLTPTLDPATRPWSGEPWFIRDEKDARTRGYVTLGHGVGAAVEMVRADHVIDGAKETFYWAEGWVQFTPDRFGMALQWTKVRGPGGWHTCAIPFTGEHRRVATLALPRDSDRNGVVDVWFRICITYTPELEPSTPIVNCAGRY